MFLENTFVLFDDESKECAVVDPGCSDKNEENVLSAYIDANKYFVKYLINTHCHIDHILGCNYIKQKYNPIYLAPEKDIPLLENAKIQAQMVGVNFSNAILPDQYLEESKNLTLGKSTLTLLYTPGHTAGEFCIYIQESKFCITGDVLFLESIGRTDLLGGDFDTLIKSIKEKLLTLPEETIIFAGHGKESSIGSEKINNPFLI
jgi:glyoxylase-like metal-dependent hydrolase (beta-lactamase superfamily II)